MLHSAETTALLRQADREARRVCRLAGLPAQDQEDVRQDLLLDLLGRLRSYDPKRGTLGAFAQVCFGHRTGRLTARSRRERAHRHPLAFDAPLPGTAGLTLADTLSEADSYGAWLGQPTDDIADSERRLDLDRAIATLAPTTLPLCAALTAWTPHDLARVSGTPRASLYRHVRALRLDLLTAGISASA
jgi:RNA polymerase sigma-70 factor (ECF subfamily)